MGQLNARTLSSLLLTTALLLLLMGNSEASVNRQSDRGGRARPIRLTQCQTLPRFSVDGVEPLTMTRGHVTLAALLTNTCGFCLSQASRLQNMSTSGSYDDIRMMIINGGARPPPGEEGALGRRVTFPVYHDDSAGTIWSRVFGGRKDDIFLIDRCGRLTYRLPFPYSYLGYNYVQRAIDRTRAGQVCQCQHSDSDSDQDPHDRMMGDAPSLGGGFGGRRSGASRFGGNRQGYRAGGEFQQRRGGRGGRAGLRRRPCHDFEPGCMRRHMRNGRRRGRGRHNQFSNRHRSQSHMSEEQVLSNSDQSRRGWMRGGGGGMGPVA